jgi:hypothetical protein
MLAGSPFAHEIDFSTGLPTGAVVYSVLGNNNLPIAGFNAVSVTPAAGALSITLIVPGIANTCNLPLFEGRTLTWTYSTTKGIITQSVRYRVEKQIPFLVSNEGVRSKLGVEDNEVEDRDIDLLHAYATLQAKYPTGVLDAIAPLGNLNTLLVINAIEARAALDVLPSLQLAVAKTEDSGTNKYARFNSVDWDALRAGLEAHLNLVDDLLVPAVDYVGIIMFQTAGSGTDRVTGAEYVAV